MSSASQPTYVVGIGSQRAGSTLLAQVLDECTPVYMHPLKELHYFDTVEETRPIYMLHKFLRSRVREAEERSRGWRGAVRDGRRRARRTSWKALGRGQDLRLEDLRSLNEQHTIEVLQRCASAQELRDVPYLEMFWPGADEHLALGEVTPEYMLIADAGVERMRGVLGPEARIILQRRDPIKRILSSFVLLRGYLNKDELSESDLAEEELLALIATDGGFIRQQYAFSDFERSSRRYRRHFDNVLELQMESMVRGDDSVRRGLSDLLETPIDPVAYRKIVGTRVNSFGDLRFSDELVAEVEDGFERYLRGRSDSAD